MKQDDYITPNYETISAIDKRSLIAITQSSLINALSQEDYEDILRIWERVIRRLDEGETE